MMKNNSINKKNSINNKKIYLMIMILALIALCVSAIILVQKQGGGTSGLCTLTQTNCAAVQTSKYSTFLGLDLVWYGILGFFFLALLAFLQLRKIDENRKNLIIAGSAFAGIAAIYLLILQAFVLHAYCVYCLIVDISSLIILGLGLAILLKKK
jgi:uncharacterized membrane protein